MPTIQRFTSGGYRFISHQFQYSGGVAAEPGFRIERARFARSVPLADGFDAIEAHLAGIGRLAQAIYGAVGSELRVQQDLMRLVGSGEIERRGIGSLTDPHSYYSIPLRGQA